jgi:hypothetical protein
MKSNSVEEFNAQNRILYGPICDKCETYTTTCRCLVNNQWKNVDVAFSLQKVYTHMHNSGQMNGVMDSPMEVLGRDLEIILRHIELCGKTVDEVLVYMSNNYTKVNKGMVEKFAEAGAKEGFIINKLRKHE